MKDKNGNEVRVGQRAVVLAGGWFKGKVGTVRDVRGDTARVSDGTDDLKRGGWSTWADSHEIAVVDDAAGEAKA